MSAIGPDDRDDHDDSALTPHEQRRRARNRATVAWVGPVAALAFFVWLYFWW